MEREWIFLTWFSLLTDFLEIKVPGNWTKILEFPKILPGYRKRRNLWNFQFPKGWIRKEFIFKNGNRGIPRRF